MIQVLIRALYFPKYEAFISTSRERNMFNLMRLARIPRT